MVDGGKLVGGEVQRPAFRKLAGWMITMGVWTILSHATKRFDHRQSDQEKKEFEWGKLAFTFLLFWVPLTFLLQVID